jgi:hypothetical protein
MTVDECRPVFPAARHKIRGDFDTEEARGRARRRMGERAGIRFFLTAVLLLASACAGRQKLKAPEGLQVAAAVVYPFGFKWEAPAYRSFELSQRLIDVALAENGDRLAYFGPSEFRVVQFDENQGWVASTALPLLVKNGFKPEQVVVLRPWAEKRVNTTMQEAEDSKGRTQARGATALTSYFAHVEVLHPSTGQVLADFSKEFSVDPFEAAARAATQELDADPDPELTEVLEGLMREAAGSLDRHTVGGERPKELPYTLALTPAEAMRYSVGTEVEARLDVTTRDLADSAVFLQTRAMFANPRLPAELAAKLVKQPPGLYVVAGPSNGPLLPGDLILGVEGLSALPQVLWRARLKPTPPQLKVRREKGGEEDVYLP